MIAIKPFDLLIFGDGKPFNATERVFRESDFFINPIPFDSGLNKATGKKLNLEFISLAKGENLYFKAPIDIKVVKDRKVAKDRIIKPVVRKLDNVITEENLEYFLDYQTSEKMEDLNGYLKDEEYVKYLKDEEISANTELLRPYKELRTGIAIDRSTRTTKEGHLFTQIFVRFEEDVYFYVKPSEDLNIDTVIIGGESKLSVVIKKEKDLTEKLLKEKENIKNIVRKTGFFKLILLSPTNKVLEIEGAKIIAKVLDKPSIYSSWIKLPNDKTGFPTRIFRLIPEGSVVYYKVEDQSKIDEIFDKYYLKPAYYELEYPYFDTKNPTGFGLSIIGALNLNKGGQR